MSLGNDRFTLERGIAALPAAVWAAFFDPKARAIWSPLKRSSAR